MEIGNKEIRNAGEPAAARNNEPNEAENAESTGAAPSELESARWSVVSFEGVAMSNLNYAEAAKWLEKLSGQKISGLCIVTDEAAARHADGDEGERQK